MLTMVTILPLIRVSHYCVVILKCFDYFLQQKILQWLQSMEEELSNLGPVAADTESVHKQIEQLKVNHKSGLTLHYIRRTTDQIGCDMSRRVIAGNRGK